MSRTSGCRDPTTFAEAFAKKRSKIAEKICLDRLLTALEDRQLLTKDQRLNLWAITNVHQRVNCLMDELEKADDTKLPLFYEALVATNQRHVVDKILKRKTRDDEFVPSGSPQSSQEIEIGDTRQDETNTNDMTVKRGGANDCHTEACSSTQLELLSRKPFTALNDLSCNDGAHPSSTTGSRKDNETTGTPHKVRKRENSSVVDTTFRLKDLRKLMGKEYDTPSIKARLVSVSETMTPRKHNSRVKEYFEMRISDGETEARVVVYDKVHLLQSCKDLTNADIVIEAGSYSVHRDYVGDALRQYMVLNSAPSLWQE